jgi:phosphatidylserine/phosphatidylglycerophosphate/cardiolipin synthase-like enzyme
MKRTVLFFVFTVLPILSWAQNIQVYFSPNGGCEQAVVDQVRQAAHTIDIAMYFLSSREIARALVRARQNNVQVRIVLDQGQEIESSSKSSYLVKHGFDVRYHMGFGLMHNKFAIIDGKALITGSFNWTRTAQERNEENLLVITDDDSLIRQYEQRFEYLWKGSRRDARDAKGMDAVPSWFCEQFHLLCAD